MGVQIGPRHRMEWQGNLGQMLKHGTLVKVLCCSPCKFEEQIDVVAAAAIHGPTFDLWDCRGHCPFCGRATHYMCSPGAGTVYRPMLTS